MRKELLKGKRIHVFMLSFNEGQLIHDNENVYILNFVEKTLQPLHGTFVLMFFSGIRGCGFVRSESLNLQ